MSRQTAKVYVEKKETVVDCFRGVSLIMRLRLRSYSDAAPLRDLWESGASQARIAEYCKEKWISI